MNIEALREEKRKLDAEIRMLDFKMYTNDEAENHRKTLKEKEARREEIYAILKTLY